MECRPRVCGAAITDTIFGWGFGGPSGEFDLPSHWDPDRGCVARGQRSTRIHGPRTRESREAEGGVPGHVWHGGRRGRGPVDCNVDPRPAEEDYGARGTAAWVVGERADADAETGFA